MTEVMGFPHREVSAHAPKSCHRLQCTALGRGPSASLPPKTDGPPTGINRDGRRVGYAHNLGRFVMSRLLASVHWRFHLDLITGDPRRFRGRGLCPTGGTHVVGSRFKGALTHARTERHVRPSSTIMKHVPNPSKACDFAGVAKPCALQSPTDSSPSDALPPTAKAVGFRAVLR